MINFGNEMDKNKRRKINEILSTVNKAKNKGLRTNVHGTEITLDNTEKLTERLGQWNIKLA